MQHIVYFRIVETHCAVVKYYQFTKQFRAMSYHKILCFLFHLSPTGTGGMCFKRLLNKFTAPASLRESTDHCGNQWYVVTSEVYILFGNINGYRELFQYNSLYFSSSQKFTGFLFSLFYSYSFSIVASFQS